MKNLNTLFLLFLGGCIGTDIENQIEPVLRISESTKSMRTTESFNFMSEYTNELAQVTSVAIIWDSSDPTIISIDQNGDATALNEGEAVISVQFDGFEDSITVDVLESKEAITISDFVSMIVVGSSFQFDVVYLDLNGQAKEPEIVSWISSVPSILSVDQEGVVFALASGTAEISVEFGNLMHALEVQSTGNSIMVDEKVLITDFTNSIILGSTYDFKASFFNTSGLPDSSIPIVWTSSDNSILSINYNGLATAEGIGKATITVTANMISTSVEVEVPQPSTDERIALLEGKSGYKISGTGVLKLMNREVILNFTEVKVEGPGPYFYLSNSQSNVNGGVKLGISKDGSSFFNVSQIKQGSTLGDYKYIIVWCEPFGVTLGFGVLGE